MVGGTPGWQGRQPAGAAHFRLQPSRESYLKYARSVLPIVAILIAVAVVRVVTGWDDPVNRWGALAVIAVVAGAALTIVDYLGHSSVTLTPTELVMVGLWRHRRVIPRADLGRCVLVQGLATGTFRGSSPNLFVLRRDGSKAMRLTEGFYPESDLIALSRALGIEVDGIAGVVTPRELRRRYPGTASLTEAHPVTLALLAMVAVIVIVVIIVVIAGP